MKKSVLFSFVFSLIILSSISVFASTFDDARDAYLNATLDVEQVKRANLPYASLQDALALMNESLNGRNEQQLLETAILLNESVEGRSLAQKYFNMVSDAKKLNRTPGQDFEFVVEKALWIRDMKLNAFEAGEEVEKLRTQLESVNETVNLTEVLISFEKATLEFEAERYDLVFGFVNDSYDLLEDAEVAAARERALLRLAQRTVVGFVKAHWLGIIIFLVILFGLSFWTYIEFRAYSAIQKTHKLMSELDAVQTAHVTAQREYYAGNLGRGAYKLRMEQYQEKERKLKSEHSAWLSRANKYKNQSLIVRRIKL